jgi:DNA-binding beta-propeller fold protein YncE
VVSDTGGGRLLSYSIEDGSVRGGTEIKAEQVPYPTKVQLTSKGEILVIDGKLRRIARFSAEGAFAGYLELKGVSSPSTIAPRGIRVDDKDNIHILDVFGERVIVTDSAGNFQSQLPFPQGYRFISDLAVSAGGTTLLLDSVASRVFAAARGETAFKPLTEGMKEYLQFPTSIATDKQGKVFILDQTGNGVVTLGQDGSFQGRQLNIGWKNSFLHYPSQLCISEETEIDVVIADRNNNRIQVFRVVR